MNECNDKSIDSFRSFQLLSEIDGEEALSQREISRRLGIAVGLVNSYLKNLVAKGYVRIKNFPRNRYAYLLTPQGVAEKSRLAYHHISYFTNLYTVARQDYLTLFRRLEAEGRLEVVFCGVDEVAEIAYLSLMETSVRLAGIMDNAFFGSFFGREVVSLRACNDMPVVITSLKREGILRDELLKAGMARVDILTIDGGRV